MPGSTSDEVTKKPRTIVLCFDGTSNEYDDYNTNIVKFFSLLKKDDFNEQLCYYQPGIGTWYNPGVVSPIFQWGAKILDEAFAWYLDAHVIDGYRFLMQNYRVGDKICIFGFSRGSYTARALAGVLYKVGLLPRDNEQQIPFAYKLYKREDKDGVALCSGFKQTFCQDVQVEFVGVWDTVSSVGVLRGRTLPFTDSNKAIKIFRHALALDEHRGKFRPIYYHRPSPDVQSEALDPFCASPIMSDTKSSSSVESNEIRPAPKKRARFFSRLFGQRRTPTVSPMPKKNDGVLEVWFAGCHSDVGGGAVPDTTVSSLENISIRWMVYEVMRSPCGILFDESALERLSVPLVPPKHSQEEEPEQQEKNSKDACEPIHDQLKENKLWWLLEIIPMYHSWQDNEGVWHKQFSLHRGKGRVIQEPNPNFHESVQQRMKSLPEYTPKALWTGTPIPVY